MILQKTPADHVEMSVATAAPVEELPVIVALHGLHDLVNMHQSLFLFDCFISSSRANPPPQPHSTNLFPLLTRKSNSVAILGKQVLDRADYLTKQIVLWAFHLLIYLNVNLNLKNPFLKLFQTLGKRFDHVS